MHFSHRQLQIILYALEDLSFQLEQERQSSKVPQSEIKKLNTNLHDCNLLIRNLKSYMIQNDISTEEEFFPEHDIDGDFEINLDWLLNQ